MTEPIEQRIREAAAQIWRMFVADFKEALYIYLTPWKFREHIKRRLASPAPKEEPHGS